MLFFFSDKQNRSFYAKTNFLLCALCVTMQKVLCVLRV